MGGRRGYVVALMLAATCAWPAVSYAQRAAQSPQMRSITDTSAQWPTGRQLEHVLTLRDYNTRVVVIGTTLLGIAAGVIGTFAYLRKRALMGDALSHATLPGIAIVFLLTGEKNLTLLLTGASITGILGVLAVIGIRQSTRLKEDAAIGIVLSVFFGVGMVLFSLVQQMNTGNEAGLQAFIYGKAAAMGQRDAYLMGGAALAVILGSALLFKEFRVVCFDQQFAAVQGRPVLLIDLWMMALVVLTTVVGLQAVGLIMVVALLIIPAAAARFWTDGLLGMTLLAGAFGAVSGWLGSTVSAVLPRMPAGAIIVLCAGLVFVLSLFFAPRRGMLASLVRHVRLRRMVAHQNLLRSLAETEELDGSVSPVTIHRLREMRSWTPVELRWAVARAARRGYLNRDYLPDAYLTPRGGKEARRILRNHRLWEMYLVRYADIAPSHVDRDADEVEHVLSDKVIKELDRALAEKGRIPPSPHAWRLPGAEGGGR